MGVKLPCFSSVHYFYFCFFNNFNTYDDCQMIPICAHVYAKKSEQIIFYCNIFFLWEPLFEKVVEKYISKYL